MSVSALETVRLALIAELKNIIAGNIPAEGITAYRNTITNVYEDLMIVPTEFPSLSFAMVPDITISPKDEAYTSFDAIVPFVILGDVSCDMSTGTISNLVIAQDSLLHDIMKALGVFWIKNVTASGVKWNLLPDIKVSPVYPVKENKNQGSFSVSGKIHIRNLDKSFE